LAAPRNTSTGPPEVLCAGRGARQLCGHTSCRQLRQLRRRGAAPGPPSWLVSPPWPICWARPARTSDEACATATTAATAAPATAARAQRRDMAPRVQRARATRDGGRAETSLTTTSLRQSARRGGRCESERRAARRARRRRRCRCRRAAATPHACAHARRCARAPSSPSRARLALRCTHAHSCVAAAAMGDDAAAPLRCTGVIFDLDGTILDTGARRVACCGTTHANMMRHASAPAPLPLSLRRAVMHRASGGRGVHMCTGAPRRRVHARGGGTGARDAGMLAALSTPAPDERTASLRLRLQLPPRPR
jgi:hypothetical protein